MPPGEILYLIFNLLFDAMNKMFETIRSININFNGVALIHLGSHKEFLNLIRIPPKPTVTSKTLTEL